MGRVATLLAAALLSLAPVASAATPSSQFEDFQSGLKLAVQAQRASDQGAYDQAEALDEQALPLFERALGPEDLPHRGSAREPGRRVSNEREVGSRRAPLPPVGVSHGEGVRPI